MDVFIGRMPSNQLVLDADGVGERHARITVSDGRVMVTGLGRKPLTLVKRKRVKELRPIGPDDPISIGPYTLRAFLVEPEPIGSYLIRDPIERQLLDAIAAGDEASRLVYADRLEGQGDAARAELLRLSHALDGMSPDAPGFERATDRLRELAAGIEPGWRARVAKRPVERCPGPLFDFACPKQWSRMDRTDDDAVRHCSSCHKHVYYCASVEEAREHAARGECVALDVTSARWPNDLDGPFGANRCPRCQADLGPGLDACPRCFASLFDRMTMDGFMMA